MSPPPASPGFSPRGGTHTLRRIVGVERATVSLNIAIKGCYMFGELLARCDARLARVAMEKRAIDRHKLAAHQVKLAGQKQEAAVYRLQCRPIRLAEVGDRAIAGRQILEQPDQLQIAARLTLKPTRRPDLIEVAVKIELQQIGRIIGWLPHFEIGRASC